MKLSKLREIEKLMSRVAKQAKKPSESKTPAEKAKELGLSGSVAERVIAAYSDEFEDVTAKRDLDYFEKTPVSGSELVKIMSKVLARGYNDFDGAKAKQVADAMGDADFHIAREGSVCIYVKPKHSIWLGGGSKLGKIKADEITFDVEKEMFRFWWD